MQTSCERALQPGHLDSDANDDGVYDDEPDDEQPHEYDEEPEEEEPCFEEPHVEEADGTQSQGSWGGSWSPQKHRAVASKRASRGDDAADDDEPYEDEDTF